MKEKAENTLEHASGAMVSLTASLKKAHHQIRDMSGKHGEQISIDRARSNGLKARLTDSTSLVISMENSLLVFRSKGKMASTGVMTLDAQRRNMVGHMRTPRSKMPVYKLEWLRMRRVGFQHFVKD